MTIIKLLNIDKESNWPYTYLIKAEWDSNYWFLSSKKLYEIQL